VKDDGVDEWASDLESLWDENCFDAK